MTQTQFLPMVVADDFLVVRPAKPKTREGRIAVPDQSQQPPWHGEVILAGAASKAKPGQIVWYSRSYVMEPVRQVAVGGQWVEEGLVTIYRQAVRALWDVTPEEREALMSPDAEPLDPARERELERVREARP